MELNDKLKLQILKLLKDNGLIKNAKEFYKLGKTKEGVDKQRDLLSYIDLTDAEFNEAFNTAIKREQEQMRVATGLDDDPGVKPPKSIISRLVEILEKISKPLIDISKSLVDMVSGPAEGAA
jgi:hypothetical protein